MILIKLPVLFIGYPLLVPELIRELVGNKLAEGNVMYKDVYESLEPLSAGVYFLIAKLFQNPHSFYILFALILIFLQSLLFNFILNLNNLFPERNYIPALLYIIISSLFIDFYTLSPVLLGTTFLLFSMHFVLNLIRQGDNDENIFYTGALVSISSLFYFPFFIFLFQIIFVFLFFTPAGFRKYFVLIMGFVFPFLLAGTYYFLRDGLDEFIQCFSYSLFYKTEIWVAIKAILLTSIVPLIYLIISIGAISVASRYINYQYIAIRIFGLWLIFGVLSLYFTDTFAPNQLYVFVPILAFFMSHLFQLIRSKWIREGSFLLFLIIILWTNYKFLYDFSKGKNPESYKKIVVQKPTDLPIELEGKKILVLGDNKSYYKGNSLGGPYLNWELSKRYFSDLDDYKNISLIYQHLLRDLPDVIIDQKNIVPSLFQKIPRIEKYYQRIGSSNVYILKKQV